MSEEQTDTRVRLEDFLASFVAQQVDMRDDEIVLKITAEEFEALGEFFIQGIAGWMLGIRIGRSRSRPFVDVTPASRMEPDPDGGSSETKNGRRGI
jgi:hypothetical protein